MPFALRKEYGPLRTSRFLAQDQKFNISNYFRGPLGK